MPDTPTSSHPILHVYPQARARDDALLAGTDAALDALATAIGEARFGSGEGTASLWAADGEPYTLTVRRESKEEMQDYTLPYEEEGTP